MTSHIARRLVILGAPGSGKGTIASRIVKTYGMPHIVVGDLLRQHIQQKTRNSYFLLQIILYNYYLFISSGK
jgi:adenylate kinase family enzyme